MLEEETIAMQCIQSYAVREGHQLMMVKEYFLVFLSLLNLIFNICNEIMYNSTSIK